VIGPNANEGRNQLGDYSYASMCQLMRLKAPENSAFLDLDMDKLSKYEIKVTTVLEGIKSAVSPETNINLAKQVEAVVLVLGDRSGLVPSCTTGETRDSADLQLPGVQEELAKAVIAAGKPVVAILINGRPYAFPWLAENANAILEAWLPGEEGGSAIADILFGDANPGGKLPITFPRSVGQVPIFYNSKPSGMKSHWYVDYVSEKVTPLYPFGHGLSYTSFEYSDLSIKQKQATGGESVDVSLQIRNSGKIAGDEVVQLYVCDEYASLPRPVKELKGFCRITLSPGMSRRITFHLPVDMLAFYDNELNLMVEAGKIKVFLGSSSTDVRLQGEFEIIGAVKTLARQRVFTCPVTIQ
jgi:beta-glucosidase